MERIPPRNPLSAADTRGMAIAERMEELSVQLQREAGTVRLIQDIIQISMKASDVEEAMSFGLQRICEDQSWALGHGMILRGEASGPTTASHVWHMEDVDRCEPFRRALEQTSYENNEGLIAHVMTSGDMSLISDIASDAWFQLKPEAAAAGLRSALAVPISLGSYVPAVIEFYSTRRIESQQWLFDLMSCIAAQFSQVIQRNVLDKSVSDSLWLMQRRVGRELHDTVCQDLVGLAFVGRTLVHSLRREGSSSVDQASELAEGLERALELTRAVSQGLSPIDCEADELPRALNDLVEGTRKRYGLRCTFDAPQQLKLASDEQAKHLYFIAQEALGNAVKHSQSQTVEVSLAREPARVVLRVRDDGIGLPEERDVSSGIGLRVMRYRAKLIDAKIDIESADHRGTMLTCTLPLKENP